MYELGVVFCERKLDDAGETKTKQNANAVWVLYYTLFLSETKKVTSRFPIGTIKRG